MPYDHEAEVERFMAAARLSDPEKHALVCAKYPVKSRWQLQRIAKTEIPVGLHPMKVARSSRGRLRVIPTDPLSETA